MSDVKPDIVIYKILTPEEWDAFKATGHYDGSPADKADGFIHFSRANQLQGTLAGHYGHAERVILLEVSTSGLIEALKWEESRGGELFPHLYSTFALEDVKQYWEIARDNHNWPLPTL